VSSRPDRGPSGGARAREAARLAAEQAARRRRERRLLIAFVVAVVVLVVGGGIGVQAWRTNRAPSAPAPGVEVSDAPQQLTDGQPIRLGAEAAPVTVALYEDFHCPHCAEFEEEFGPTLTAAQNAGTVRIELYPMAFIDQGSSAAANAMACATEAGFGQRYYRGLFANHTLQWSDSQLLDLAGTVGGSAAEPFGTCVRDDARAGWVSAINAAAEANGVKGTPTLFVDGEQVELQGLTPESLQARIDAKR
jgi:protein-disulfide isomerase